MIIISEPEPYPAFERIRVSFVIESEQEAKMLERFIAEQIKTTYGTRIQQFLIDLKPHVTLL